MAKNKKPEEVKSGLPPWMATYGDMVTLLLCFFVLMFASSTVDAEKFQQIVASFSKQSIINMSSSDSFMDALGNGIIEMPQVNGDSDREYEKIQEGAVELSNMAANFKTYFAENNIQNAIEIEQTDQYLTLSFNDGILFDSGKAEIKPDATSILSIIAEELLKYPTNDIKIEGHTDNVPIKTDKYPNNWYLSAARAISVATFFTEVHNFEPNRISTEGYGEYRPKISNDTDENRSINRRVEIKILNKYYSENTDF